MNLRTTLYDYQQRGVDKLVKSRVGGLFVKMGRGKTRMAIELVYLRRQRIDRVVWFCPVSLKATIAAEIIKHTDCTEDDIYIFDDNTRQRTLPLERTWYIVGIESISSSARVVLAANRLITKSTFVILDESSYIKGHRAKRTQRITAMASEAKYRLILTGTPISQGIVDLYTQMYFLSPKILGYNSFYSFSRNHLEYSDKYRGMIVRSHNTAYLAAKIAPYVYQITDEEDATLQLPGKLYDSRFYHMTIPQADLYMEAKRAILPDLYEDDHTAIYRLFTALQQIVCGYWQNGNERYEVPHRRIHQLVDIIANIPAPEKIVIWAKYHYAINQITERLRAEYGDASVAEYHGGYGERQRQAQLDQWRSHEETRFLVATQATGGHGLDFTVARYVIFYANSFKYAERIQAEERNHRIGSTRPVTYIDLVCAQSIDMRIMDALARKGNVVDDFRAKIERMKGSSREEIGKLVAEL